MFVLRSWKLMNGQYLSITRTHSISGQLETQVCYLRIPKKNLLNLRVRMAALSASNTCCNRPIISLNDAEGIKMSSKFRIRCIRCENSYRTFINPNVMRSNYPDSAGVINAVFSLANLVVKNNYTQITQHGRIKETLYFIIFNY